MHPKLLNQVWVCRGTGVINRGAQLIISTLKAASGVHLWVNLVVSLSIGVVCFCGHGESECGVCVCLCWNGLFCPTILPVRSFLSLSLSLTGRVGSCQCGRRSGRGLFMMGVFCFVLFFSPIFVSTSRNLFWVQWGSPSGRVRGWVYPLYPPPSACSLCLHRYLSPLACPPPPLPPFLYVLLSRCQPSSQEPFVPESPPIYSSRPFN